MDPTLKRGLAALASAVVVAAALPAAGAEPWTLADAVRLAVERSPAVAASRFDEIAARERISAAWAAYLPTLSAEGGYGRSYGYDEAVTNGGETRAVAKLETTLFDGGAGFARGAEARSRLSSTLADARARRATVAFAAKEAYLSALVAKREKTVQSETVSELEGYVALVDRQERGGGTPAGSTLRAKLALEGAKSAVRLADADLAAATSVLAALTGVDARALELADPGEPTPIEASSDRIDDSPAVAAARADAEAVEKEAHALDAERWGKITFSADGGALGIRPEPTFRDDKGGEFSFGARLPLLDVAARRERAAKRAEIQSARRKLADARQSAELELARFEAGVTKAKLDLDAARVAAPLADESFLLLRARSIGGGEVRTLEVLDAVTQRTEARLRLLRAEGGYQLAVAAEARLLGEVDP